MKRVFLMFALMICTCLTNGLTLPGSAQTTEQIAKGNCGSTAAVCESTLSYCVKKKGRYGEQTVTNALKDCITACKTTETFLTRSSRFQNKAAAIAIDACTNAAKVCDAFASDKDMKSCADECRKCASNLQKVAAAANSAG